jgi:anti-anti-sigma factor
MLEISVGQQGEIVISGRFDAAQEAKVSAVFDAVMEPRVVDLSGLEYISSMGLGILIKTQKRVRSRTGGGLKLVGVNPHVLEIFRYAGFLQVFEVEPAPR